MRNQKGFTLIELMVVVSIIGILAAIAIPQFNAYMIRAKIAEGYQLARPVMEEIVAYYDHKGVLPTDNAACGLPAPELIKGKYVLAIRVTDGKLAIRYDRDQVQGAERLLSGDDHDTLFIRPVINHDEPTPVVSWETDNNKAS